MMDERTREKIKVLGSKAFLFMYHLTYVSGLDQGRPSFTTKWEFEGENMLYHGSALVNVFH